MVTKVVNPQILSQAGMPAEGVAFATCLSAAVATLVMGLYANYPIALAPGMSLNAYFTYSVCLGMNVPWQTALGVIFFSGVFFALVGLRNANLVVASPTTLVTLGSFRNREAQLACVGLAIMLILMTRKITGAILIGVIATTLLGIFRGLAAWPAHLVSLPHPSATWLKLDLRAALHLGLLEIVFVFLFVDLFDNVGTLLGV